MFGQCYFCNPLFIAYNRPLIGGNLEPSTAEKNCHKNAIGASWAEYKFSNLSECFLGPVILGFSLTDARRRSTDCVAEKAICQQEDLPKIYGFSCRRSKRGGSPTRRAANCYHDRKFE